MDHERISRNDPCPCGSGRKFKKCCYNRDRRITAFDRAMAIERLEECVERNAEQSEAMAVFFGDVDRDVPAMTEHFLEASDSAFFLWFAFDYPLVDGCHVVDQVLRANPMLSVGERRYLEQMRATAMMPFEVVSVRPGISMVLRRLGAQREIEVLERTASQTLQRWDVLLARLNPLGPSGAAEMEMGVMHVPPMVRAELDEVVHHELGGQEDEDECTRRCKELAPLFHSIWLDSIVSPRIPTPVTMEGDPVVRVTLVFDVHDEERVTSALNAEPTLTREPDDWLWVSGDSVLGRIKLAGSQVTFETQSEPRAERGRQLLEGIAHGAIAYRSCTRVDLKEEVKKALQSGNRPQASPRAEEEIPPEIQDQLFQEYMARHSQNWLDDHIPALDHQTPRFAARSTELRPRLVGLLKDIENQYFRALAAGEPAFDPTWMWDELELSDERDAPRMRHPLWLGHESMEEHLPGIAQAVRSVVERRSADELDLKRTVVTELELGAAQPVRELMRNVAGRVRSAELLSHLEFYCNYELHRRKTFWVDESLAWMLANTRVDVESSFLRLPFPSYVLVYTDRHTLGVAERALARDRKCPLHGQMLGILCAYMLELPPDGARVKVGLTFDAFAGRPPHLMTWELHLDPRKTMQSVVTDALERARTPDAGMFQPILEAPVNATLYTTSAGVNIEKYRGDRSRQPQRDVPAACPPGDAVYYLPGKIEISHMRKLRQVARGPNGRALMHRFMVRGHWRRPNLNWKDQSPRWIEPYWRGPSLASIIEREYRVRP